MDFFFPQWGAELFHHLFFWVMFKSHFKPTWCPTWPNLAPKTLQNGAPDPSLEQLFPLRWKTWKRTTVHWFCLFFHVLGDPLSPKNWCLDTTCNPTRSPSLLWTTLVMKIWKMGVPGGGPRGGRRTLFFELGTLLATSWAQLALQMVPRLSKKPSWDHFGALLVPFWCQFWNHFGP